MYKSTDRQAPLFEVANQLSEKAKEALKGTWAEVFRQKIFPILLQAEDNFADLYDSQTGRGCRSVARKLGMLFLQQMHDLTDKQIVANALFDARYQYALQVAPEEAYLSRQSLSDFRRRLVAADPQMKRLEEVFVRISEAMVEDLDLETAEQRTDATRIVSNIETKGRKALFRKTIDWVDRWMLEQCPGRRSQLPDELLEWLDDESEGEFGGSAGEESLDLEVLAGWVYCQKQLLVGIEEAEGSEVLEVLTQLLDEHCIIESHDGEPAAARQHRSRVNGPADRVESDSRPCEAGNAQKERADAAPPARVEVRESPKSNSDSLQSPYDPDAGFRADKGPGYNMHITETCNNEETKPEALTDIEVEPMDTDTGRLSGIVERLHQSGRGPKRIYADAGYTTADEIIKIRKMGTEPTSPISRGNQSADRFGRERFEMDTEAGEVRRCPAGNKPYNHGMRHSRSQGEGQARHAYFYASHCASCPKFERCPTRAPDSGRGGYLLELHPNQLVRDRRLAEQKTDDFKEAYAIRAGIEGTTSELKRRHGVGELRVRRLPRVRMEATLKSTACNVKRWAKWLLVDSKSLDIGAKPPSLARGGQIKPQTGGTTMGARRSRNWIGLNRLNFPTHDPARPFRSD